MVDILGYMMIYCDMVRYNVDIRWRYGSMWVIWGDRGDMGEIGEILGDRGILGDMGI